MNQDNKCITGYTAYFLSNYLKHTYPINYADSPERDRLNIAFNILSIAEKRDLYNFIKKMLPKNNSYKIKAIKTLNGINRRRRFGARRESIERGIDLIRELRGSIYNSCDFASNVFKLTSIKNYRTKIIKYIIGLLKPYTNNLSTKVPFNDKINTIKKYFKLNEVEKDIIIYHFIHNRKRRNELSIFEDSGNNYLTNCADIAYTLSYPPYMIKKAIRNRILKEYILDADSLNNVTLDDFFIEYLSSFSNKSLGDRLFYENKDECVGIDKLQIQESDKQTLLTLLKDSNSGVNILFHGKEGTGKTELAKSLGTATSKKVYFIKGSDGSSKSDKTNWRITALIAALNVIDSKNSIIVMDEADSILNTRFSFFMRGDKQEKGELNRLLETVSGKVIWIVNHIDLIERSTLRRFSFNLEFKDLTKTERLNVWENILKKRGLIGYFSKAEIEELSASFYVNPGAIALSLDNLTPKIIKKNKDEALLRIKTILEKHEKLLFSNIKKPNTLTKSYSLDGLNISTKPNEIIDVVSNFYEKNSNDIRNMNILLVGPPGTGKTEFAKYLSESVRREIIVKPASELLSCYVGETEKNIESAFHNAERSGSILFLDEADSFFTMRTNAVRSWEVTQTNEMLYQMENFKGVLICATNLKEHLDPASIRRFNFKIEFNYLDNDGKVIFYKKILNNLVTEKATDDEIKRGLSYLDSLTPGDFKVVYQKNFYLKNLTHDKLFIDLKNEVLSKPNQMGKGRIGFR